MSKRKWSFLAAGALILGGLSAPQAFAQSEGPLTDPIPEDPSMASFGLVLDEFASFPKSEPTPAPTDPRLMRHARINSLGEIPDGSGRKYVPDLNGTLYLLKGKTPAPYLDVKESVGANFFSGAGMGSGFGFVTFHPEFKRNGKFYTVHTEAFGAIGSKTPDLTAQPNTAYHSVITEWTAENPRAGKFSGTHREVLRLGYATRIHAIQQIDFNPTADKRDADYGLLYVASGDGGIGVNGGEPQNLATPQGKILRIDPEGDNSDNGKYGIPGSNPFVGESGKIGEIFAYGMRDPHRFSWDRGGKHRMLLGHIGEKDIEAIYDVRAGDNLGWSEREGTFLFDKNDRCNLYPLPADDATNGYTYPVAQYDHNPPPGYPCGADVGRAVSGGFVYRGQDIPELRGKYVFADLVDGRVFYTEEREMRRGEKPATIHELAIFDDRGRETTMPLLAGDRRVDLRIGQDGEGELFLLAKANGKVWEVEGTKKIKRGASAVFPGISPDLVAHYDFDGAKSGSAVEKDKARSGTDINLINGGAKMRVRDGAFPASRNSMQVKQVDPVAAGNDDWKAGIYSPTGVPTLRAFNAVSGTSVMGWIKMTGDGPSPNTVTTDPSDTYNAIGLAGVLSGNSDGHGVRALLELINVNGELNLVALGRRLDDGASQTFAATEDWRTLLPRDKWVHITATFDFNAGTMALYKDGKPIPGTYTVPGDPWQVSGPGPDTTSPTDPRGIKIGGSFPQNTVERNPCNCRMDSLMFLDRSVTALEVNQQYRRALSVR